MRRITVKYAGECRKCGADLGVGVQAIHEKRVGLFCLSCEPTDVEDIREYRQEAADRRADRYDRWAEKRRAKAAALEKRNDPYRGDIAFNTQPGHIPERARAIKRTEKAWEHTQKAQEMERKASSLRCVRVKGDKERARQKQREAVLEWLRVGMRIHTHIYGLGTVVRINRKTARINDTGSSGTYTVTLDLSWIHRVDS
jgi:hypothetical protein